MSFSEDYRKELVSDIVNEVDSCYDYKDFAADCVRQVVSDWDDSELAAWFGREGRETDCLIADNIDCYSDGLCEHTE